MANISEKLKLIIEGDSSKAVSELNKMGTAAKSNSDKASKAGGGFINTLTGGSGIQGAALGATAAVAAFGVSSVKAAVEGEAAHARLNVAIHNVGGTTDQYGGKIDGVVQKMAKFGFENDDVESSLARLIPVTHDVNAALKLQGTAADIAAATGKDLAGATQDIASALEGKTKALAKDVGANKEEAKSLQTIGGISDAVSKKLGGSAAAAADTFSGKMKALSAETHNLQEQFGALLLPALTDAATGLQFITSGFTRAANSENAFGQFLKGAVAGAVGPLALIGHLVGSTANATKKQEDAVKDLNAAQAAGKPDAEIAADKKKVADATRIVTVQTNTAAGAIKQGADAANAATIATKRYADAEKDLANKLQLVNDLQLASIADSNAVTHATNAVGNALDDYNQKSKAVIDTKGKDAKANRDLSDSGLSLSDSIGAVAAAAGKQKSDMEKLQQTYDKSITNSQIANDAKLAEIGALQRLEAQYPALTAQINRYIATLGGIPRLISTTVLVNGKAVDVHSSAVLNINPNQGSGHAPGRAIGGPVSGGSPYMVGERGPELFVPGSSGRIIPNGAGGGVTFYATVNVATHDDGDIIMRKIITAGRRGTGVQDLKRLLAS